MVTAGLLAVLSYIQLSLQCNGALSPEKSRNCLGMKISLFILPGFLWVCVCDEQLTAPLELAKRDYPRPVQKNICPLAG